MGLQQLVRSMEGTGSLLVRQWVEQQQEESK
jgi:hypothetical protein